MKPLIAVLAFSGLLFSQAKPVEVKRVQAEPKQTGVPAPDRYPFGQLIQTLENDQPQFSGRPNKAETAGSAELPRDFTLAKEVVLPATAMDALAASRNWMDAKQTAVPGKDGRVLYTFGEGLPTVVCAPLRLCVIELELGERLVGEPHIGDAIRWAIEPATSGQAESSTALIVLKPKQAGLDTNLLLTTDRRSYYFRLISKAEEYLARIAFAYPEDEARKWQVHLAQQSRQKADHDSTKVSPVESLENLYFDYRIESVNPHIRPIRVIDDGKKTFIQMTPEATHREAPVLVVLGPDGPEMVNYRVKGEMYLVDRLFERGALLLGVGKNAQRAEIIRGSYRGKTMLKGDPYASVLGKEAEK